MFTNFAPFSIQQAADHVQDGITEQAEDEDLKPIQFPALQNKLRTGSPELFGTVIKNHIASVMLPRIHMTVVIEVKHAAHYSGPPLLRHLQEFADHSNGNQQDYNQDHRVLPPQKVGRASMVSSCHPQVIRPEGVHTGQELRNKEVYFASFRDFRSLVPLYTLIINNEMMYFCFIADAL